MQATPTFVIFFNDWKVFPGGINAGGGEVATMSLARAIASTNHRVIVCANLPQGERTLDGIEFWNFGADYSLHQIEKRLRTIGPYYCLAATLVHPFLLLCEHTHCLARVVVNHSPSPYASGLEPQTVMELVDHIVCVSQAQRSQLMTRGVLPEKVGIIKNGFDPEIFSYAGPEGRDWNRLVYIGRLEAAKGIHIAAAAFSRLKAKFPDLRLDVFGDTASWPEFAQKIPSLQQNLPGFVHHGKVPQNRLAEELKRAGLLIFPSISFESAGLAVIDAQASGCPAVGFGVGGVPEYLFDRKCGEVVYDLTTEGLESALTRLLSQPQLLAEMSTNCATVARDRPWDRSAAEYVKLCEKIADQNRQAIQVTAQKIPDICQRTIGWREVTVPQLIDDHEIISVGKAISQDEIERYCRLLADYSAPFLWKGLVLEGKGKKIEALQAYDEAYARSDPNDWQALFRLTLLQVENGQPAQARRSAEEILRRAPQFHFADQLKLIIERCRQAGF